MNASINLGMKLGGRVRLSLYDAKTRKRIWRGKWESNLVFDTYLNALANNSTTTAGYANAFSVLKVGSGTNANEFNAAGSAIFTQVGNTVTAASSFFTSAMVGGIFKYGATGTSNGAEQYISGFTSATQVTVSGAGMTVATPTAGAVFMVQQTGLQTFSFQSSTYASGAGMNGFTFVGNVATLFRTFVFAQQGSSYSVNEVGYATVAQSSGLCNGRIVLGSTVTVPPTNFLVAQFQLVCTQSPSAQVAQANVGTGINTAGTAMLQCWDLDVPNASTGANSNFQAGANVSNMCSGLTISPNRPYFNFYYGATAPTLQTSIQASAAVQYNATFFQGQFGAMSNSGQPVGVGVATCSYSTTSAGQSCKSFIIGGQAGGNQMQVYVINLTTPVTLPTGSLQGTVTWTQQWSRTLVN